jgi:arsenite methyltransferase
VGGALPEAELVAVVTQVGFQDARIVERFDCFAGTSAKHKLSKDLFVQGANLFARKPG